MPFFYICGMKLIVDSGSTKATWIALSDNGEIIRMQSAGMNPALLGEDEIIAGVTQRIPKEIIHLPVSQVYFYAAGCRGERESTAICEALKSVWSNALAFAGSDMLGAARAVCGLNPGVACILGTGSNCAVYSPSEGITAYTPPLGFILGDEGSGADIGKAIVNAALKGVWSKESEQKLLSDLSLTQNDIIERVYRSPEPNRFLATFARWASDNIENEEVENLIVDRFTAFIQRNIKTLRQADGLPAGFVGSVAAIFEPQLRQAAGAQSIQVSRIIKSPDEGLILFHSDNQQQISYHGKI